MRNIFGHSMAVLGMVFKWYPLVRTANRSIFGQASLLPWLLLGNDLRGLPGWSEPRQRRSGDPAVLDDEILQVSARRAKAGISWRPE
jgi:hypothetical protein